MGELAKYLGELVTNWLSLFSGKLFIRVRARLHRASGFSRRGLVLYFVLYKSSIFFIRTRVKQSSSCFSRKLLLVKSGYTAFCHDNLAISQRKKLAGKTASGEKKWLFQTPILQ